MGFVSGFTGAGAACVAVGDGFSATPAVRKDNSCWRAFRSVAGTTGVDGVAVVPGNRMVAAVAPPARGSLAGPLFVAVLPLFRLITVSSGNRLSRPSSSASAVDVCKLNRTVHGAHTSATAHSVATAKLYHPTFPIFPPLPPQRLDSPARICPAGHLRQLTAG